MRRVGRSYRGSWQLRVIDRGRWRCGNLDAEWQRDRRRHGGAVGDRYIEVENTNARRGPGQRAVGAEAQTRWQAGRRGSKAARQKSARGTEAEWSVGRSVDTCRRRWRRVEGKLAGIVDQDLR